MSNCQQLPLPLHRSWPVGARLRFKTDAILRSAFHYLRGSPVLVLSGLQQVGEPPEWRQYITAFGARYPEDQFGWALPEQLEPIPGEWDEPMIALAAEPVQKRVRGRQDFGAVVVA
jgi:hypothetical protein